MVSLEENLDKSQNYQLVPYAIYKEILELDKTLTLMKQIREEICKQMGVTFA